MITEFIQQMITEVMWVGESAAEVDISRTGKRPVGELAVTLVYECINAQRLNGGECYTREFVKALGEPKGDLANR